MPGRLPVPSFQEAATEAPCFLVGGTTLSTTYALYTSLYSARMPFIRGSLLVLGRVHRFSLGGMRHFPGVLLISCPRIQE